MSYPIYMELSVECPSPAALAKIGRRWLVDGVARCASDLLDELRAQVEQPPYGPRFEPAVPDGVVGLIRLDTQFTMGVKGIRSYTEGSWEWFMRQVDSGNFYHAEVHLARVDGQGAMIEPYMYFVVKKTPELDGWVHVVLQTGMDWLYSHADLIASCVELFFDAAGELDASFGNWTEDGNYRTQHELAMSLFPDNTIPKSREYLRGYGWLTVIPPEIALQLGGAARLDATGEFYSVRPLANGAVGLIACQRAQNYSPEIVERLGRLFADVLMPSRRP